MDTHEEQLAVHAEQLAAYAERLAAHGVPAFPADRRCPKHASSQPWEGGDCQACRLFWKVQFARLVTTGRKRAALIVGAVLNVFALCWLVWFEYHGLPQELLSLFLTVGVGFFATVVSLCLVIGSCRAAGREMRRRMTAYSEEHGSGGVA